MDERDAKQIVREVIGTEHALDDCAVLACSDDLLVVTTDMLHESTDFPAGITDWQIGWMSAAVSLSDIAAMGARPGILLLAVGLDHSLRLRDILEGAQACCRATGAVLAGGDLDSHQELTIVSSGIGFARQPRFDLLKLDRYSVVTLQFSRGCPYRCEFYDIIVMFGRKPRWKAPAQIGRELDELRKRNIRDVFFVDDNLIGNRQAAKALLEYLKAYQERDDYRFIFGTEVSLNVAHDHELLGLFRAANFAWVFIGIESPDIESLKETGKSQNLRHGILGRLFPG